MLVAWAIAKILSIYKALWALPTPGLQNKIGDIDTKLRTLPKDFKICVKRGYKMQLLQQAIDTLRVPAPLPEKNKDHNLIGDYSSYRECHLAPDWLLIYKQTDDELRLNRTGSHADLFGM